MSTISEVICAVMQYEKKLRDQFERVAVLQADIGRLIGRMRRQRCAFEAYGEYLVDEGWLPHGFEPVACCICNRIVSKSASTHVCDAAGQWCCSACAF